MAETEAGSIEKANWESAGVSECEKCLGGNSDLQSLGGSHDAPVSKRVILSLNFLTGLHNPVIPIICATFNLNFALFFLTRINCTSSYFLTCKVNILSSILPLLPDRI